MYASSIEHFSSIYSHLSSSPTAPLSSPPSYYLTPSNQSTGSNSSSDDLHYIPTNAGTSGGQWSSSSYHHHHHRHHLHSAPAVSAAYSYDHSVAAPPPSDHYERSQYDGTAQSRVLPLSKYIAVGVQWVYSGEHIKAPMIARVSITDAKGCTILDTFVRPTLPVTDYRFTETGLQDFHLHSAPHIAEIQERARAIIESRIVVGYQLWNFFSLLQLTHPAIDTRDIASFIPFRKSLRMKRGTIVPLPILVTKLMGRRFGEGYEHPLENARACLDLFRSSQTVWENLMQQGLWPCSTLEDVPEFAYGCFT